MRVDENGRECNACGQYKVWAEYNRNVHGKNGYDNRCRDCLRAYRQSEVYKEKNRERSRRFYHDPVGREIQKARMAVQRKKSSTGENKAGSIMGYVSEQAELTI